MSRRNVVVFEEKLRIIYPFFMLSIKLSKEYRQGCLFRQSANDLVSKTVSKKTQDMTIYLSGLLIDMQSTF